MMPEKGEFITNIMPERKVPEYVPPIPRRRFELVDGGKKHEETPKQARERYQKKRKIAVWSSLTALGVGGAVMGGLEAADQAGSQHPAVIGWQGFKEGVKQIGGKLLYSLGFNKEGQEVFADLEEEATLVTQAPAESQPVVEEAVPIAGETVPESTQETTPVATGEVGPVEDEGVTIPAIEGLKYDARTNTFFAIDGNTYGLEAETKAGIFIKDAFEFNGQMENSIGLRPEVIEILQQKYLEENKELKFPIPFNLEKDKGITMEIVKNEAANNAENLDNTRWKDFTVLGVNAPKDTIVYAPLKTSLNDQGWDGCGFNLFIQGVENCYFASTTIPTDLLEKILYKGSESIDWGYFSIAGQNMELLSSDINKDNLKNAIAGNNRIATDIGSQLFAIINSEPDKGLNNQFRGEFILNIDFTFFKFKDQDGKYVLDKDLQTGENIFLKLDKNISISILPAND